MQKVIITLKIMPTSPDTDLTSIAEKATEKISAFGGEVGESKEEPIAFGLKAVILLFVIDEAKGSTDSLEEDIATIDGVNSVNVTDVRRTLG